MSSQNVKVGFAELSATAGQMRTTGGNVGSELLATMNKVQTLVASEWQGAASAQFEVFYTSLNSGWSQVQEAIEQIASLLDSIGNQYQEQENAIAGSLRV